MGEIVESRLAAVAAAEQQLLDQQYQQLQHLQDSSLMQAPHTSEEEGRADEAREGDPAAFGGTRPLSDVTAAATRGNNAGGGSGAVAAPQKPSITAGVAGVPSGGVKGGGSVGAGALKRPAAVASGGNPFARRKATKTQ